MRLDVDEDELAACVACGLCLPHCPTYRVTGEEAASPRGRIAAMRAVHAGAAADDAFVDFMERCVQCRACEAACPSSVPFGRLMEGTRATLLSARGSRLRAAAYGLLGRHRLLLAGSTALAALQRAGVVPRRLGLPRLPLRRPALHATGTDVWLFTGCVMDAWMRPVHAAAKKVIEATGAGVALPGGGAACCGALHVHAGLVDDARDLAVRVMAAMPGDAPILVDSAGCGAALKDYGHLVGTAEAHAFAARVLDVHQWLAPRIGALALRRLPYRVAVQDPCHLRHVQKAHLAVRTALAPVAELVELNDDGLCCGAGGSYAVTQPALAGAIRDLKVAAIARTGAAVVVSANPGCLIHLRAAGLDVRHPVELLAEALD
jgi:glycolate oxidase iron-sulfur subunit